MIGLGENRKVFQKSKKKQMSFLPRVLTLGNVIVKQGLYTA